MSKFPFLIGFKIAINASAIRTEIIFFSHPIRVNLMKFSVLTGYDKCQELTSLEIGVEKSRSNPLYAQKVRRRVL